MHLKYFQGSMFEMVASVAAAYPKYVAFDFMGRSTTYAKMIRKIEQCAKALKTIGIRKGDCVTIAMPNCPQAIYVFYAVNLIGGIASMVHPLSSEKEIEFYLNESRSVTIVTLDQFYGKIEAIRKNTGIVNVILARIKESYSKLITRYKCNFMAGVPTLYEALLRLPNMTHADLSHLKGVFSGGDSLSIELKKKFDDFLSSHNSSIRIREGYGTTECVTASCLTPVELSKEGSIGIPFPDTYYKIVKPDTDEELPYGEEGEILISGPTVMAGYYNRPEETARALRVHADGMTWLYTGDLGIMDNQGFIYFKGRIKRMIITSGYNVYPAQLENIIDAHEKVQMSCVIGVPDQYKMQKVKAFVMLKPGIEPSVALKEELLAYCRKYIARYAMPYDIEFRKELPKTLVGKVAYRVLEEEEAGKAGKEL